MISDELRAAKIALRDSLKGQPWLRGVGIGDVNGEIGIRVNVATQEDVAKVPTTCEGVPVGVVVVGDIGAR